MAAARSHVLHHTCGYGEKRVETTRSIQRYLGNRSIISTARSVGRIFTTRNRQRPLSVAGYRRMVARAESGGCSQPRLAPHVRLQVSKWVETPGRSNAIWETGRLSRPPDRSRILEGLTLPIENALARLHRACNPAVRAFAPLMPRHRYDAPTIWLIVRINPQCDPQLWQRYRSSPRALRHSPVW